MLSVYGKVLIGIFSFVGLLIALYQLYRFFKLGQEKTTVVLSENFSINDWALICRALSDSMNYHPDVRFDEKWELLLRCKRMQLHLESKTKKR